MAVTMDEIEEFMQLLQNQDIGKISDKDLRKAIRHYWNVASKPTVDSRIETLEGEDWIEKVAHADAWKINEDRKPGIEEVFREEGR